MDAFDHQCIVVSAKTDGWTPGTLVATRIYDTVAALVLMYSISLVFQITSVLLTLLVQDAREFNLSLPAAMSRSTSDLLLKHNQLDTSEKPSPGSENRFSNSARSFDRLWWSILVVSKPRIQDLQRLRVQSWILKSLFLGPLMMSEFIVPSNQILSLLFTYILFTLVLRPVHGKLWTPDKLNPQKHQDKDTSYKNLLAPSILCSISLFLAVSEPWNALVFDGQSTSSYLSGLCILLLATLALIYIPASIACLLAEVSVIQLTRKVETRTSAQIWMDMADEDEDDNDAQRPDHVSSWLSAGKAGWKVICGMLRHYGHWVH